MIPCIVCRWMSDTNDIWTQKEAVRTCRTTRNGRRGQDQQVGSHLHYVSLLHQNSLEMKPTKSQRLM